MGGKKSISRPLAALTRRTQTLANDFDQPRLEVDWIFSHQRHAGGKGSALQAL